MTLSILFRRSENVKNTVKMLLKYGNTQFITEKLIYKAITAVTFTIVRHIKQNGEAALVNEKKQQRLY